MALDGIFLYSISEELKNSIINSKVEKINQPEKDELILLLRKDRSNYKLLISASPVYPRIHFTNATKENPLSPPMFCMLLRKHLNSSRLVNIRQLNTDRVIFLDFESKDELGFNSIYTLVIEIMGKHSNITLIRERDNIIMDSIKHVTPNMNSFRSLYPGIPYVFPPSSNKLNPLNYNYESLRTFVSEKNVKFDKNFSAKVFEGVSSQFSKEIHFRIIKSDIELHMNNLQEVNKKLSEIFDLIKTTSFYFASYKNSDGNKDFYCLKLYNLEGYSIEEFSTPSELIDKYYADKDKGDRLHSRTSNLQKLINNNLDRCYKKLNLLNNNLEECKEKEKYRVWGELLTANIYNMKPGDSEIKVLNYYNEDEEYIDILLDPNKTPSVNIQNYYRKYNKLKKSEEISIKQIEATEEEIKYLQSVLTNIANLEDYKGIDEIKKELMEAGYIKFKRDMKKKDSISKPIHFLSSEGIDIYVGKNNIQNDYLTLKFANKNDIWMHTKNMPGSHVVIKTSKKFTDKTLEEGANLAAYYSKAKDSSNVPVDYTEIRNVHKPNGAKPGMVIYYTNKTIYITPEEPKLERVN
ncbi:NFACT RNA binding domain-containing protein [uncultured Clostridium sp.]|uniref:Rqc2 family fibronectin-binding protein n=1 Tax=uncultured Clostridium sp. TaxID=59620 RepID=UPI0028E1972B|nr:NFACT RNA binding domain-containing protein [uncultured Clostridium sp.]